jgi:hypothetical protein
MDRIPSASEIREWPALEPFVLQPAAVTDVYQNSAEGRFADREIRPRFSQLVSGTGAG